LVFNYFVLFLNAESLVNKGFPEALTFLSEKFFLFFQIYFGSKRYTPIFAVLKTT